jgi:uncharacterized protein with HEPN domain
MTPRIQKYLSDALQATKTISQFLEGTVIDEYVSNEMLRSAVERQFEIVGEALKLALNEKEDLEVNIPDLWKIIGLRNRIIHGYDTVDDEMMWDIAQFKLPELTQCLRKLLDQ